MRDIIFPRWTTALFVLLPFAEILYVPVNGQTMYAAALASLICAFICAIGSKMSSFFQKHKPLQWLLAICAVYPLAKSVARMSFFLVKTAFPKRPVWSFLLVLSICVLALATIGLNRCAMWALPIAVFAGIMSVLSALLTLNDLNFSHFTIPNATVFSQIGTILCSLLPSALVLSIALPEDHAAQTSKGLAIGGSAFALICLRSLLLLGVNTASMLAYPNFSAAGLAMLGDFARHGEVFFSIPLLLCEFGKAAALAYIVIAPIKSAKSPNFVYGMPITK